MRDGGHARLIAWSEIDAVSAYKKGKITYDELFLVLESAGHQVYAIGELDNSFEDVERLIRKHFPQIPSNWRESVDMDAPLNVRIPLYVQGGPSVLG